MRELTPHLLRLRNLEAVVVVLRSGCEAAGELGALEIGGRLHIWSEEQAAAFRNRAAASSVSTGQSLPVTAIKFRKMSQPKDRTVSAGSRVVQLQ